MLTIESIINSKNKSNPLCFTLGGFLTFHSGSQSTTFLWHQGLSAGCAFLLRSSASFFPSPTQASQLALSLVGSGRGQAGSIRALRSHRHSRMGRETRPKQQVGSGGPDGRQQANISRCREKPLSQGFRNSPQGSWEQEHSCRPKCFRREEWLCLHQRHSLAGPAPSLALPWWQHSA